MVHILYGYGDRTPFEFYPNDPYKGNAEWKVGERQLTNSGKMICFGLFKWIRSYYGMFLSDHYNPDEIYANVDRTIISAEDVLAGLFPTYGNIIWNIHLPWQPLPVHVVPQEYNLLFLVSTSHVQG